MMHICQRLTRVIVTPAVYPRFLNFFTLTFRALGTYCYDLGHDSRMTSCLKECAQLHSELCRRRHSTRQSHGLFALAKHLFQNRTSIRHFICRDIQIQSSLNLLGQVKEFGFLTTPLGQRSLGPPFVPETR